MKKIFINYVIVFIAFYVINFYQTVNAEEPKINSLQINTYPYNEINLDTSSNYHEDNIVTDTISVAEQPIEDKNNENNSIVEKKHFFSIFNLQGGVEKTDQTTEQTVVHQWLNGNYATGKWFGARPILESHGLTVNSSLLYSPFLKTGGGAYGEASAKGYSLFNLGITIDTEKAGLWKGGTFYTLYQRKTGYGLAGPAGGAMGDWMDFDGWDARQINQISECYYQQKLFNNKIRLKVGKQDANNDFGYLNSGWDFINLAFSVIPTVPMPTYPDQSTFGFVSEINPQGWLSIRNGIYSKDNAPFNITELEIKSNIKKLPGRYSIGAWEMSDRNGLSVVSSMDSSGNVYYNNFNRNFGMYAQFEQMVYKEKKDDKNDIQGLVVFGQFGLSPSTKNDMCRYVSGGLHYVGLIPKRDNDKAGIAVGSGTFAKRLGDITSQIGDETSIEAFYKLQLTPWLYLQPDVQFIMNPGGAYSNSVAIGLRSVITF